MTEQNAAAVSPKSSADSSKPERLLTFSSGGWVLAVAGVMVLLVILHRGSLIVQSLRWRDGKVPWAAASNGFDLSQSLIPVEEIVQSGNLRDFFRPLTQFEVATVADVGDRSRTFRKFIANAERVVGVRLGEERRAYPIRILAYHEIIEDTLGGVPIAITYSPFSDSVVVFDRRIGINDVGVGDGAAEIEPTQFGYSGLLYNSNLLFYDRQEDVSTTSLFSQLQARAISGPRAGQRLRTYPFQLMTWQAWSTLHPETTTIGGKASYMKKKVYEKNVYGFYHFQRSYDAMPYAVKPLPDAAVNAGPLGQARPLLSRMLAIHVDGEWHEVFHEDFKDLSPEDPANTRRVGSHSFRFRYEKRPECLSFECDDRIADLSVIHCYWYAWYALRSGLPETSSTAKPAPPK